MIRLRFTEKLQEIRSSRNTETAGQILEQEELHGAIAANRFRYMFIVFILSSVVWNSFGSYNGGNMHGISANLIAMVLYAAVTAIHSVILKEGNRDTVYSFSYIAVFFDFIVITFLVIAWTLIESPDNFAFQFKNPALLYYLLPIAITVVQFRLNLVMLSVTLFLITYSSFLIIGFAVGMPLTSRWSEYILGSSVIASDIITTRPAIYILVAAAIGYAIYRTTAMVFRMETVESRKTSLARYFPPAVSMAILDRPELINTPGTHEAAILFCTIRDFPGISEDMTPGELQKFLWEIKRHITGAVFSRKGTVTAYSTDTITAAFGIPFSSREPGGDSLDAITGAFAIHDFLASFNETRAQRGDTPVTMDIGIHTGEVFAGNTGSEDRPEYTVTGSTVSTASRIGSFCKHFNTSLIISGDVYEEVKDTVTCKKLPRVKVKGKEKPLVTYEVLR